MLFGGKPSLFQVYGFGCFDANEGIVTLRNPSPTAQEYTLALNSSCGADERLSMASLTTILPYSKGGKSGSFSFGDTVRLSLSPFETRVLHFNKRRTKLCASYCKAKSANTLEVTFNQTVIADNISCMENTVLGAELLADYRSVLLTFEKPFEKQNTLTLLSVSDILKNESNIPVSFTYYEDSKIGAEPITGSADFSVRVTLDGEKDCLLYFQGDELSLSIKNGYVYFKVGEKTLVSSRNINDVVQICAVRERNGLLKLYLNQKVDSAVYPDGFAPLCGKDRYCFSEGRVKLFDRALAYDEV